MADTNKALNDHDALEHLKRTLTSCTDSFLQILITNRAWRHAAVEALCGAKGPRVDSLAITLRGGKADVSKILESTDELGATLKANLLQTTLRSTRPNIARSVSASASDVRFAASVAAALGAVEIRWTYRENLGSSI